MSENKLTPNRNSIANFFRSTIPIFSDSQGPSLNDRLLKYKEIRQFSEKTGISPILLLLILLSLIGLIMIGYYEDHLTIVIGTFYPLYFSLKTLKRGNLSEIKRWLTYWIFFTVFIWFECFFYFILKYIPLYFVIRSVFLVLSYLPQYEFSTVLYDYCIKTFFTKYNKHIIKYANHFKNILYGELNEEDSNNNRASILASGLFKSLSNRNFIASIFKSGEGSQEDTKKLNKDSIENLRKIDTGDDYINDEEYVDDEQVFMKMVDNSDDENDKYEQKDKETVIKEAGKLKGTEENGNKKETKLIKSKVDNKDTKDNKDPYFKKNKTLVDKTRNVAEKKDVTLNRNNTIKDKDSTISKGRINSTVLNKSTTNIGLKK